MRAFSSVGLRLVVVCVVASAVASASEDANPRMARFKSLAAQFSRARSDGVKSMSPVELVAACDRMAGDLDELIRDSAANPSAKSKSQRLLSQVHDFSGKGPA